METAPAGSSGDTMLLSSKWDGLSPHLIASFYPVERKDSSRFWQKVPGSPVVRAPLTECTLDVSMLWQSPFENAGQGTSPTMKAMLSSGAFKPWVGESGKEFLGSFEGRSGMTKLNSTQVFNGMPPIKFQVTALFRAWADPESEVSAPVNQLMQWALPRDLADDGPLLEMLEGIKEAAQGKPLDSALSRSMLPSIAPTKIAMKYKDSVYMPLVIESMSLPLGSPVDASGRHVHMQVTMTICSLAAIDRNDWDRAKWGKGFSA